MITLASQRYTIAAYGGTLDSRYPLGFDPSPYDYFIGPSGSDSNDGLTTDSPWAITSLTESSANYASVDGKTIGLLDGTYDVSSFGAQASGNAVRLRVPGGTIGSPTVIKAVTPRAAILTAKSGATYIGTTAIIGNGANGSAGNQDFAYVTLKDLTITGCYGSLVSFCGSTAGACVGVIVEGCHIYDLASDSNASNRGGVMLGATGVSGALVKDCKIHDCYVTGESTTGHANASCIHDWAVNTVVEYCELYSSHNLIYQKSAASVPQGMTIRYNYLRAGDGVGTAFAGFNNADGSTPPYTATNVHHNVIEEAALYYQSNGGSAGFQADWNFYNNTIYQPTKLACVGPFIPRVPASSTVRFYNNVIDNGGNVASGGGRGAVQFGGGTPSGGGATDGWWTIIDYNRWDIVNGTATFGTSNAPATYPTTTYSTFAAWKATASGPAPDAHSTQTAPVYTGGTPTLGGGASQYALASGGGYGTGSTDGTTGGAACDMGAWGGASVPTQIGSSF